MIKNYRIVCHSRSFSRSIRSLSFPIDESTILVRSCLLFNVSSFLFFFKDDVYVFIARELGPHLACLHFHIGNDRSSVYHRISAALQAIKILIGMFVYYLHIKPLAELSQFNSFKHAQHTHSNTIKKTTRFF